MSTDCLKEVQKVGTLLGGNVLRIDWHGFSFSNTLAEPVAIADEFLKLVTTTHSEFFFRGFRTQFIKRIAAIRYSYPVSGRFPAFM